jgi:hypothetical protein
MPQPIITRIALLEDGHQDLSAKLAETAKALHDRIDQQQKMLESLRGEMASGFGHIQTTLTETTKDAMNSMPMWAADRLHEAAQRADRDANAKGVLLGAAISLLALIGVLISIIVAHIPV